MYSFLYNGFANDFEFEFACWYSIWFCPWRRNGSMDYSEAVSLDIHLKQLGLESQPHKQILFCAKFSRAGHSLLSSLFAIR
jgi:hypothetical protein